MQFQKITLIGVGLLGGSLGLAVKRRRLAGRVEGYVRRTATIAECRKRRAVDLATLDLPAGERQPRQFGGSGRYLEVLTPGEGHATPAVEQQNPVVALLPDQSFKAVCDQCRLPSIRFALP